MPYESLLRSGRLKPLHLAASGRERRIRELLGVARRELSDAALTGRSADGRHNSAYAAARAAAEALMAAEGYRRGVGEGQHAVVFEFLRLSGSGTRTGRGERFDEARRLRNLTEYDRAGVISYSMADALLSEAEAFVQEVADLLLPPLTEDETPRPPPDPGRC